MTQTSEVHPLTLRFLRALKSCIRQMLRRDPEALTALWDSDGVLLRPGRPAIAEKSALREFVEQGLLRSPSARISIRQSERRTRRNWFQSGRSLSGS